MTNSTEPPSPPNYTGAPTAALWDKEMERIIGALRPGRNVEDFAGWKDEVRRQFGHHPYGRLRRAVSLMLTQVDEIPTPMLFGMFVREAERQLADEAAQNMERLLPFDAARKEQEQRTTYAETYKRTGPGTEPFERNLCIGIARARNRKRRFASGPGSPPPSSVIVEPTDEEVQAVYDERRKKGVPIGRLGTQIGSATRG